MTPHPLRQGVILRWEKRTSRPCFWFETPEQ